MIKNKADLRQVVKDAEASVQSEGLRIMICAGTGCVSNGSLDVYAELLDQVSKLDLPISIELEGEKISDSNVTVKKSGCHGFCEKGPLVKFEPLGLLYTGVKVDDVQEIVEDTLQVGKLVNRLVYHSPTDQKEYPKEKDIPFYKTQQRIALANCGNIDPEDIDDYLGHGGYQSLEKVLFEMDAAQVCQEITDSGLRGRGGAGFPTGRKWEFARMADADQKYIIVNGDEGDPGAFMDRSVMEGDPHRVIEGVMIGAYATGASKGYIYVRAEYPLAVKRLQKAIADAEKAGLLGENILGSGFDFDLQVKEGAGAFVCGEETALIASIEGDRGMPRPKPPFPAQSGLWGKPTNINNVETLANIPIIIEKGSEWFNMIGQPNSTGTKTFAITGDIANTGLIEIPMGVTLREVIYEIGGGIKDGKEFKAVQMGGPSGGTLTSEHLDLKLDFDSLQEVGAMVGSGGMVVMDEDTCMVEVARFFLSFTQQESCGKCTPCRVGTRRMLDILERITAGEGQPGDVEKLTHLGEQIKKTSLCALGKTAPNPVLTTTQYFRDEYEAHIEDKKCPARQCEDLATSYKIDPEICIGCGLCKKECPVAAITGEIKQKHEIDPEICIACGACEKVCPVDAIS